MTCGHPSVNIEHNRYLPYNAYCTYVRDLQYMSRYYMHTFLQHIVYTVTYAHIIYSGTPVKQTKFFAFEVRYLAENKCNRIYMYRGSSGKGWFTI